jgi:thiol:disulfide interchange protein
MNGTRVAILAIAVLFGAFLYRSMHPKLVADGTDSAWDEAVHLSHESGQPAVFLYTAGWCPGCQQLHNDVLSRDDVQHELNGHYIFYEVDLTDPTPQARAHARTYGASEIPLLVRYDKNGNETGRRNNLSAEDFIAWLKAGE